MENIQRADLNAIEEARAFQRLMDEFGLTQEQVGDACRAFATLDREQRCASWTSAPEVQAAIEEGTISGGHGARSGERR